MTDDRKKKTEEFNRAIMTFPIGKSFTSRDVANLLKRNGFTKMQVVRYIAWSDLVENTGERRGTDVLYRRVGDWRDNA